MVTRPRTIQQLAADATVSSYDPSRSLKDTLRAADTLRNQGKQALQRDDLETAFVNTARAVTIIVEKIPKHPDYAKLNSQQKQNLSHNGQTLLETLEKLKIKLIERHDEWEANGGEEAEQEAAEAERAQRDAQERLEYEEEQRREEYERKQWALRQEEERRRSHEEDQYRRRDAEDRERAFRERRRQQDVEYSREETDPNEIANQRIRAAKQRQAEEYQRQSRKRDQDLRTDRRLKEDQVFAHVRNAAGFNRGRSPSPLPVPPQLSSRYEYPTESEYQRPRVPSGPRAPPPRASPNYPSNGLPESISYITPKRKELDFAEPLPLESPTHHQLRDPDSDGYESSTSRGGYRRPSFPAPITTTSPGPHQRAIEYPKLMTSHQKQQGYIPSSNPLPATASAAYSYMYAPHVHSEPSSYYEHQFHQARTSPYYSAAQASSPTSPNYAEGSYPSYPSLPGQSSTSPYSHYPNLQRAPSISAMKYASPPKSSPLAHRSSAPSLPPKVPLTPPSTYPISRNGSFTSPPRAGSTRPRRRSSQSQSPRAPGGLRYVWLPQACLERFLSIAAVNTARKVETCGLLLGKLNPKSGEYMVHTLLIPRQTSDENSCTMTEEEMVIEFQEKRDLVTLGWIHTHPTQSCFMSSLDLHTHSGFQTALPEAFAIVCAPTSDPKFGVFALTNPQGLQTIVNCEEKAAFHPHPNKAIYTDADHAEGHVKMADLPLEIADLRSKM